MALKVLTVSALIACVYSSVISPTSKHDPSYSYAYDVQDPSTGDFKNQFEVRNGNSVEGSYSLLQPDGIFRTVNYVADENGFNAVVNNEPAHGKTIVPAVATIATKINGEPVAAVVKPAAPPAPIASPAPIVVPEPIAAPAPIALPTPIAGPTPIALPAPIAGPQPIAVSETHPRPITPIVTNHIAEPTVVNIPAPIYHKYDPFFYYKNQPQFVKYAVAPNYVNPYKRFPIYQKYVVSPTYNDLDSYQGPISYTVPEYPYVHNIQSPPPAYKYVVAYNHL